jgi:hypothetical protein
MEVSVAIDLTRRRLLTQTTGGVLWAAAASPLLAQTPPPPAQKRPDPLPPAIVNEFVRIAHSDLNGTRQMLTERPSLLNATWDWGAGDFETGLGGAGHMGNHEIAEFLIGQGARLDVFVAAMLGKLDIVRALLTTWPGLRESKGPHGITLMRHAQVGAERAVAVVEYLKSLETA